MTPSCWKPLRGLLGQIGRGMIGLALLAGSGCGTTKMNSATEQILSSDAADRAVAKIDFTPLAGQRVFFDTQYMQDYKGIGFVNSSYVISGMRQQMTAAGLLLQDKKDDADFVVEGRIGTLGSDSHEVVFGLPASNASALSAAASAASVASGTAPLPGIPELSLGRRNDQVAATKIACFAYERETRERVWQSGTSLARATANDTWVLGIGPFHKGSIYNGKTNFAGAVHTQDIRTRDGLRGRIASFKEEAVFDLPANYLADSEQEAAGATDSPAGEIQQAGGESTPEAGTQVETADAAVPDTGRPNSGAGLVAPPPAVPGNKPAP